MKYHTSFIIPSEKESNTERIFLQRVELLMSLPSDCLPMLASLRGIATTTPPRFPPNNEAIKRLHKSSRKFKYFRLKCEVLDPRWYVSSLLLASVYEGLVASFVLLGLYIH